MNEAVDCVRACMRACVRACVRACDLMKVSGGIGVETVWL